MNDKDDNNDLGLAGRLLEGIENGKQRLSDSKERVGDYLEDTDPVGTARASLAGNWQDTVAYKDKLFHGTNPGFNDDVDIDRGKRNFMVGAGTAGVAAVGGATAGTLKYGPGVVDSLSGSDQDQTPAPATNETTTDDSGFGSQDNSVEDTPEGTDAFVYSDECDRLYLADDGTVFAVDANGDEGNIEAIRHNVDDYTHNEPLADLYTELQSSGREEIDMTQLSENYPDSWSDTAIEVTRSDITSYDDPSTAVEEGWRAYDDMADESEWEDVMDTEAGTCTLPYQNGN